MNFCESFLLILGPAVTYMLGASVAFTVIIAVVRVASPILAVRISFSKKSEN